MIGRPEALAGMPGFSDDDVELAASRLRRFPAFDQRDYESRYPDVTGADAARHVIRNGGPEGRVLCRRATLVRVLGDASLAGPALAAPPEPFRTSEGDRAAGASAAVDRRVLVLVSSTSGLGTRRVARDLAIRLRRAGRHVDFADESAVAAGRECRSSVVVGPHEFFYRGLGPLWAEASFLRRTVVLNTAQIGSAHFSRALPFLFSAAGVLEASAQVARMLSEAGVAAARLDPIPASPLPTAPATRFARELIKGLPPSAREPVIQPIPWRDRTIAASIHGCCSDRRQRLIPRILRELNREPTFCHIRPRSLEPAEEHARAEVYGHVALHTSVHMYVRPGCVPHFAWQQIVDYGLAAGAVVLAEPMLAHPRIEPGVHYIEAPAREFPHLVAWLRGTPEGQSVASSITSATAQLVEGMGMETGVAAIRVLDMAAA